MTHHDFSTAKPPSPPYFAEGIEKAYRLGSGIRPTSVDTLIIGDSIAEGWPLSEWLPSKTLALGVGGDRIENVSWRLQEFDHTPIKAKNIVLCASTNNLWSGDSADITYSTLKTVILLIEKIWKTAEIVTIIPPKFGNNLYYLNNNRDIYKSIIQNDNSIKFVDAEICFNGDESHLESDHIHFSLSGYKKITQEIKTRFALNNK